MKWVAIALFLLAIPLIAGLLKSNSRYAPIFWGGLTFLPFVVAPWHLIVAPFATPMWSGYVKGWQFSAIDALAIAIIFGTRGKRVRLSIAIPFLLYTAAVFIAVVQARFPNLALGYPFQLVRVGLVVLAAARAAQYESGEKALLTGLVLGLALQAGFAGWEWLNGALQTVGSMGHQNLLGFVSHMALMPVFAMFLAGRWPRRALCGVLAGVIVVILTASRATIVVSGFCLVLTLLLSLSTRFTSRKMIVSAVGVVILALCVPLAQASLERRFAVQNTTFLAEDQQRIAFERAAKEMLANNWLGVGPNHYVFIANTEGYSERAKVNWSYGNRSANVHNSYLLVAAETGYPGVITVILLLAAGIWVSFATALKFRREPGAEVLLGVGAGLVGITLHGLLEWMFLIFPTQYLLAASLGLVSGLRTRYVTKQLATKKVRRTALSMPALGPDLAFGKVING